MSKFTEYLEAAKINKDAMLKKWKNFLLFYVL